FETCAGTSRHPTGSSVHGRGHEPSRRRGGSVELTLFETRRRTRKKALFGVGLTSVALHTGVIAAAVYATLAARPGDTRVKVDTTVVLLTQEQHKPPEPPAAELTEPIKGFQTVVVPTTIPTNIP